MKLISEVVSGEMQIDLSNTDSVASASDILKTLCKEL